MKHLNPHWKSKNINEEEQFEKAMALVLGVFVGFVTRVEEVWLPAKEIVRNAVNNRFTVRYITISFFVHTSGIPD